MGYRYWKLAALLFLLLTGCFLLPHTHAQSDQPPSQEAEPAQGASSDPSSLKLGLVQSMMCEKVENLNPIRQAITFSVAAGQVCCFTSFDPVLQPTLVYHRWYHRDELSTQTRLRLYPPKWATYSVIQLRETDKGPWRVEITDQNGHVFDVLRFSIVD
ncbi:MAG: DUF2914 domain-containing protein [Syntrophobacteraceae bacterium]|nr:DUF2914 domain-containing protein [Desulfobacteraceae bacterium]